MSTTTKCMWAITFRKDKTPEECIQHWQTTHADLILKVPGVVRYIQNITVEEVNRRWDGVAELWFEDRAAYDALMASQLWQEILADGDHFIDLGPIMAGVVEEHHVVESAPAR